MIPSRATAMVLMLVAGLLAGACTPNEQVRDKASACVDDACPQNSLEVHDSPQAPFALGFVEFDDQGRAFDPGQETALFDYMARRSADMPLAIITFVHGWKHNVRADDGNVTQFRALLSAIATFEAQQPPALRRAIVGVYAGWRGQSIRPEGLDSLSFWGRKDAAHRVADGSVRSLLGKLRAFRDYTNLHDGSSGRPARHETRMLTIGHSFGGLIVYSALAQYYTDRAAASLIRARYFGDAPSIDHRNEKTDDREISSYGDLVVLVNPAYEAVRYEPIRQLLDVAQTGALPGRFAPRQSPVLVQITSVGDTKFQGDWATGLAFPAGRMVNTALQATRVDPLTQEDERDQIEQAIGHFTPFWTHDLDLPQGAEPRAAERPGAAAKVYDPAAACRSFLAFEKTREPDGSLLPNWRRTYLTGAVLRQLGTGHYDPLNPFWVVRAHPSIILDHNDILAPVFVDFVAQLYGDIDRVKYPAICQAASQPSLLRSSFSRSDPPPR